MIRVYVFSCTSPFPLARNDANEKFLKTETECGDPSSRHKMIEINTGIRVSLEGFD
jgi:hypothetical protein